MNKEHFDLTVEQDLPFYKVALRGVLDSSSESVLRDALDSLLEQPAPHVILDCAELSFVNSASFGLFFHYHRLCESLHGRLDLCRLPPKITSMVQLLGLSSILRIHNTYKEARGELNPA